ncbi:MAG: Gfo/Idh/MocA family oxidoreductase, partial [Monoglobales bacterium]
MANSNEILDQYKTNQSVQKIHIAKKLKVAIIGTGWIAGAHIQQYKEMPDVEVVAGADLIEGKAEKFFKDNGIEGVRCYRSHKELLEAEKDLDAVSICTYNATHAECAIDSLNA